MSKALHKPRFMSYLSLFTFSMLALVVSDNFLQLFFGWEGVGLCSYLLIGFWYKKNSANNAAIKAFIVNSAKWKAAEQYALDRGQKFIIINEDDLGLTWKTGIEKTK